MIGFVSTPSLRSTRMTVKPSCGIVFSVCAGFDQSQIERTSVLQPTVKLWEALSARVDECEYHNLLVSEPGRMYISAAKHDDSILRGTYIPFVIHFFVPVMIQCFPSSVFVAVVCNPNTSLPANASDIYTNTRSAPILTHSPPKHQIPLTAKHINFFPPSTSGTTRAFSSGAPKLRTGGRPMTMPALMPSP